MLLSQRGLLKKISAVMWLHTEATCHSRFDKARMWQIKSHARIPREICFRIFKRRSGYSRNKIFVSATSSWSPFAINLKQSPLSPRKSVPTTVCSVNLTPDFDVECICSCPLKIPQWKRFAILNVNTRKWGKYFLEGSRRSHVLWKVLLFDHIFIYG